MAQVGHDKAKLVAGTPAYGVPLTHLQIESAGNLNQQFIADGRAKRVIDATKAIQIKKDDRRLAVEATGISERLPEAIGEQVAIGQVG